MTKALVVDDDPLSIEYVVEMLTTCGFTAETAVNGEDAVKKAENEVYDLIIMDIELPGMDGVAATRIIKSKPGYENIEEILENRHKNHRYCREYGPCAHIFPVPAEIFR